MSITILQPGDINKVPPRVKYRVKATKQLGEFVGRTNDKLKLRLPGGKTEWFKNTDLLTEDGKSVPKMEED